MYLLNYLYFAIITFYGYKFLTSGGREMSSPFDKEQRIWFDGPETFWILTFSTGLLAFSAPGALDLMAIRLMVLELLCLVGLAVVRNRPVWSSPLILYAVYLVWIVIGCVYSPAPAYGFRVVLKYLYPILVALFASAAVRNAETFLKASLWARRVALVCVIFSFVPLISLAIPGVFWYGTARAINFISIMVFSLGLYYFSDTRRKNLFYAALFVLPCFLWVFRTSIMGSLVAIMMFYFFKYKLRSLPIIFGIIVMGVVLVFTIPSLRKKMFKADQNVTIEQFQEGKVGKDNIESNARYAMWEYLEERFYKGHEIAGSGTGSVQHHFYTHYIFGGLKVPHSDFVQIRCDNGMIALVLYVLFVIACIIHCFRVYNSNGSSDVLRLCAIVAGASMAGVSVTLYSDNVVNYSMCTLSMPFGFYGMMLGLAKGGKNL